MDKIITLVRTLGAIKIRYGSPSIALFVVTGMPVRPRMGRIRGLRKKQGIRRARLPEPASERAQLHFGPRS